MRGKILLVLGVLIGLGACLYVGMQLQDQKILVPEKVVEYTTQMTEQEVKILTEQQEKDFQEAGFRTDAFRPIETRVEKGGVR